MKFLLDDGRIIEAASIIVGDKTIKRGVKGAFRKFLADSQKRFIKDCNLEIKRVKFKKGAA